MGVYLDREAMEILDKVREKLARELGVSVKHISPSMVVKYLYNQVKRESSS
ncbi:hypothetical protein JCM16138_15960 [Thermococcus atlanticus]